MNNTPSRNTILARLRTTNRPANFNDERSTLNRHDWNQAERIKRFSERMTAVRAEIHHATPYTWIDVVRTLCTEKKLNNLLIAPDTDAGKTLLEHSATLPPLKLYRETIDSWKHELFYNVDAALTQTQGGIAETGSLILMPNCHEPRLMSLVPPIHIALLDNNQLHNTFADAIRAQNWAQTGMPTNALLISGPSKSADIEQTLAYGVHGPKELIVIIVSKE